MSEESPIMWRERNTKSTLWDERADKGGYKVHALPQPKPNKDKRNKSKEEGRSQKLMLFKRGKLISDAAIW